MPRHMTLLSFPVNKIQTEQTPSGTGPTQMPTPTERPTRAVPGQQQQQQQQKQQQQQSEVPQEFQQEIRQMVEDVMNAAERLRSNLGTGFDPRSGNQAINNLKQLVNNLQMMMSQMPNENLRKAKTSLSEAVAALSSGRITQVWNPVEKAVFQLKKLK